MSRAAEILHVTQPTLSKQLKSLEEELGKKLFTRHSFSIKLTEEGILLRNRAEDLVRMADTWGLIIPENDPLAKKESIRLDDLIGLPLFCSDQAWNGDIKKWAGSRFSELQLEGSFRLSYNGSIFTKEGLGYLLTYDHLIDTSKNNGLAFRPLSPKLENKIYFAWNRYQAFTPIAERFLSHLKALML